MPEKKKTTKQQKLTDRQVNVMVSESTKKNIEITCDVKDFLELKEIKEFQGDLKKRDAKDIDRIIRSIFQYGFSFPFFIWKDGETNFCLDGHGRISALREMQSNGYEIPALPVVYVDARDEEEAKNKLLRLNSRFGEITREGFEDFTIGIDINVDDIDIGIDFGSFEDCVEKEEIVECRPYNRIHVLLSFRPDVYPQAQELLEKIRDIDGVEYEQGAN